MNTKRKGVQVFSKEYLEQCKKMTPESIVTFLEDFRKIHAGVYSKSPSKLISIKVPEDLLRSFKEKAALHSIPYQRKIKELMRAWLREI